MNARVGHGGLCGALACHSRERSRPCCGGGTGLCRTRCRRTGCLCGSRRTCGCCRACGCRTRSRGRSRSCRSCRGGRTGRSRCALRGGAADGAGKRSLGGKLCMHAAGGVFAFGIVQVDKDVLQIKVAVGTRDLARLSGLGALGEDRIDIGIALFCWRRGRCCRCRGAGHGRGGCRLLCGPCWLCCGSRGCRSRCRRLRCGTGRLRSR